MGFDYATQLISQGCIMYPEFPYAIPPIQPNEVMDHVVMTGSSSSTTIGIQGTVN